MKKARIIKAFRKCQFLCKKGEIKKYIFINLQIKTQEEYTKDKWGWLSTWGVRGWGEKEINNLKSGAATSLSILFYGALKYRTILTFHIHKEKSKYNYQGYRK